MIDGHKNTISKLTSADLKPLLPAMQHCAVIRCQESKECIHILQYKVLTISLYNHFRADVRPILPPLIVYN